MEEFNPSLTRENKKKMHIRKEGFFAPKGWKGLSDEAQSMQSDLIVVFKERGEALIVAIRNKRSSGKMSTEEAIRALYEEETRG